MKHNLCSLAVLLILSSSLFAQKGEQVLLKSGAFRTEKNIRSSFIDSFNKSALRSGDRAFAVVQFEQLPSEADKRLLAAAGIELLDYLPDNSYTVTIRGNINSAVLESVKAKSVFQLIPEQKMESRLASGRLPASAIKLAGTIDLWVSFPKTFTATEVIAGIRALNMEVLSSELSSHHILSVRVSVQRIHDLAAQPFIEFVQAAPKGDEALNYNSRAVSGASFLNAAIADGGKGLNGEGVVIGVGDNADVQTHIDFRGRLINRSAAPVTMGHGHHVTGIAGGSGNGIPAYRGYASKATIVSQAFNGIIFNAPTYVNDYGMVITNNSYGDNIECDYHGTYDLYSRLLDQMAIDYPQLQNVFSAGNSGLTTCTPFLPNYHTVLGGYQSAKNVLTVGASNDSGLLSGFSSRGPVKDGRIKPEIIAMGQFVASTWAGNIYSYNNGTSMAGPAVAGGLALMYQRYRQLNGGTTPKNGLMKAILCNGATDRGNTGPDYQYGFGWMNLLRSIDMIEKARYFIGSSTQAGTNNHVVAIPANTVTLKVMLYWNDPAASVLSQRTLVNDLDLEVVDPSGTVRLPVILDSANANLNTTGVSGADHRNNMEQVIITAPASGNYTLRVKGTAITQNPAQEYFLVYDIIGTELLMHAPAGGETMAPTTGPLDMRKISWEAHGLTGTGTLEFSMDNGASWSLIANNINLARKLYSWWVPAVATNQARVRITKDGTGESSTSGRFTIIGTPVVSLAATQCEGYFSINWTPVASATDYEVMMLQGDEMKPVATTTGTTYTFNGLNKDTVYWVTVRPRINGIAGTRATAISRQPNNGTCTGSISDNDVKLDAIVTPSSGRRFTSTQLSSTATASVRIKNLDDVVLSDFDLKYSINGSPFVTEHITVNLAPGGTYTHVFSVTADLSAPGLYNMVAVVKSTISDPVPSNDTAFVQIKHLDNQPLDLTSYFTDNLEAAADVLFEKDSLGVTGADRYDFSGSTVYKRLRTFINTGIAYSGSKALTLDASRYHAPGNTNYLYGSFNLVNYSTATNDLRLDFMFNSHGQLPNAQNRVWIRGNDTQAWIEVYNLDANSLDRGLYKKSGSIELSDLLAANGQNFGTSFQVRWGQWGQAAATDRANGAGYSFDDIRVYQVFNDLQMLSIDEPITASCGLTNNSVIKVTVRNSDNSTINTIPVRYRINNGSWVSETIPSIAGNTSLQYSFTTVADLSALGNYTITALVDFAGDTFRDNDTIVKTIMNAPVITSFPYLQNFEGSDGYWYAAGKNSTWQYGTPSAGKINRAASGAKAWKTGLNGHYNDNENSYLYSPCFNITGMTAPTLSFSFALDLEDCGATICDAAWAEYSADGITWTKLGTAGSGTNWYNKAAAQVWSIQNFTRWHVATAALPAGLNKLRIRFVFSSDPAVNREGIAIDDIHIFDNTAPVYDGATTAAPIVQTVSGNNWIHFDAGGKRIASVQPNNQAMGATGVEVFINTNSVRYTASQYYHNRNITVKPANTILSDSVSVRFYFLETEVDTLVKATGCSGCTKPVSAYDLGITKYSDANDNLENGMLVDNITGLWTFIQPASVAIVPYDKGYYAEFKVKDFSEFWLNNGGIDHNTSLPVKLIDFTAQKMPDDDVLLNWTTGSESDVLKFEIELARGNEELQAGNFIKIGEVVSPGNSTSNRNYNFTDEEADKFGARYYRLKIINLDGSFLYSPIRSVVFTDPVLWQVYPNPSASAFNLVYQLNNNTPINLRILDGKGRLMREYHKIGNGLVQKFSFTLAGLAAGVYILQVDTGDKKTVFKLFKQ